MTFGEFIKAKREDNMLSQRQFAAQIGVSPVLVSYFESGQRNAPKLETLQRIAEVLTLNDLEKSRMLFLAAQKRYKNTVSHELADYLYANEYAMDTLRLAQECQITDEDWRHFTNYICNKYL